MLLAVWMVRNQYVKTLDLINLHRLILGNHLQVKPIASLTM